MFLFYQISEIAADISRNRATKYTLAEHASSSSHYICMEEAKLVKRKDHYLKTKIKEAIEIEKGITT